MLDDKGTYKLIYIILCGFLLFISIPTKVTGQQRTPSQTVDAYAKADYNGIRLTHGDYLSKITAKLLSWYGTREGTEGGYDTIYIIKNYKIINEMTKHDHANVTIQYNIVCIAAADKITFRNETEVELVHLATVNNEWRLLQPIVPPRLSIEKGIIETTRVAESYKDYKDDEGKAIHKRHSEASQTLRAILNSLQSKSQP